MNNRFEHSIQQIEAVTESLSELLVAEKYQELNEQLIRRLDLLKSLDAHIRESQPTDYEWQQYQALLKNTQQVDKHQLKDVHKQRSSIAKSTIKIDKGRSAVGIYQNISKS